MLRCYHCYYHSRYVELYLKWNVDIFSLDAALIRPYNPSFGEVTLVTVPAGVDSALGDRQPSRPVKCNCSVVTLRIASCQLGSRCNLDVPRRNAPQASIPP